MFFANHLTVSFLYLGGAPKLHILVSSVREREREKKRVVACFPCDTLYNGMVCSC